MTLSQPRVSNYIQNNDLRKQEVGVDGSLNAPGKITSFFGPFIIMRRV